MLHATIWTYVTVVLLSVSGPDERVGGVDRSRAEGARPETSADVDPKASDPETLEQRFRETLKDAVFQGTWQMTNEEGLKGKAALSEPRADKYTISKVTKIAGDRWLVMARVQYGDKDVTVPIPVRVVWAGDTPIITLDDITMPGLGTYSARVMVYRHFYSGTWFGDCYGGILSGQIVKASDVKTTEPSKRPPKAQPTRDDRPAGDDR